MVIILFTNSSQRPVFYGKRKYKILLGRPHLLPKPSKIKDVPIAANILTTVTHNTRLRWSKGSVLAFGTHVRGFKPDRSRWIFQGEKILCTPSFGGEVKPSVPCRRFRACKRSLNATWKSGKIHRPFLAQVVPPFTTRVSGGDTWLCK